MSDLRVISNNAFTVGEKLTYAIHYGPIVAGSATIETPSFISGGCMTALIEPRNEILLVATLPDMLFEFPREKSSNIYQREIVITYFEEEIEERGRPHRKFNFVTFSPRNAAFLFRAFS